jgi:uncharacterized protein YcgI (DUF1989 family)
METANGRTLLDVVMLPETCRGVELKRGRHTRTTDLEEKQECDVAVFTFEAGK